ncbi:hypothetical protein L7F22_055158 [Adiantum nelumboides]|nr:hypothetical protein [Adiantum nelumboides]
MAVSFPTFYGHENARDFMDSLEMAHLMAGRDQEEVKLRAFPLVLKGEARVWYDALAPPSKATWPALYGAFLNKYGQGDTPENLWKQLLRHRQGSLGDYNTYESKFTNLWERWAASLQGQGGAPNFLKRDKFVEGMFSTLKEKVEAKFPQTFEEAQEIDTVKFKKLLYQERKSNCVKEREEVNVPQHTNNAQPRLASVSADSHQDDLLHKLTQQLETLTLNLVQAPTRGQQPRDDTRPLRKSTQELRCWNCNETSHDEILNEVARHERYTVCDGYSGYYQIRIAEEDQHKTTFITPWGCFAFRVMPFGLTNAPSTFTRFTSYIFQPFFGKSIRVFLDDFCTYSDRALHCQRVEEGLQRLYQYGGQLNPDKCHVAEKEVVLLGHVISQEGIKVDPSRVQAILDSPPPNSARQVITFVQKVRYMSRFIHLLSQIISPLQQLANQEVFSWEQEHLECFNEVKEVLGSLPTIMPPNPQGIYYLCPSVGLDAFGAVLMQKDPKTAYMRPIYFTSKVMTQGQKGYTDIEQLVFFNCSHKKV